MKQIIRFGLTAALALGTWVTSASADIKVVAGSPELAAIAKEVGGSKVDVHSVARPDQDYHHVDARPSDVAYLSRADLFVRIGLDLDLWADALLGAAKNPKVAKNGPGYVDASEGVKRLDVPTEQITGASGDIHVLGNPHYYFDPVYGKRIAYNILAGLHRVDPKDREYFNENYKRFAAKIDAAMPGWKKDMAGCAGESVVVYHKDLEYFLARFGVRPFGYLEPKPGIPPSPAHLSALIKRMKAGNVKAMVILSVYPERYPKFVARQTGASVQWAPYSVGAMDTRDYVGFIDKVVDAFQTACR